jgi:hypothetical protein
MDWNVCAGAQQKVVATSSKSCHVKATKKTLDIPESEHTGRTKQTKLRGVKGVK